MFSILIFSNRIRVGTNVRIDFGTRLQIVGNLIIGDNVSLRSHKNGYHAAMSFPTTILVDCEGAEVKIGNNSRINGSYLHAQKSIIIGENCVIASGVQILDSNGHEVLSYNRTIGRDVPKPIIIGNNVWIGINAIILKGSLIGDNCVIGANSVIKGKIENNSIVTPTECIINTLKLNENTLHY